MAEKKRPAPRRRKAEPALIAPVAIAPVAMAPVETASIETASIETASVDTASVETAPVATAFAEPAPRPAGASMPALPSGLDVDSAVAPSRDAIARLAYQLWRERGAPAADNWLEAERRLRRSVQAG